MKTESIKQHLYPTHIDRYNIEGIAFMRYVRMKDANLADLPNNSWNIPKDGKYTWSKGKVEGEYVYGVKNADGMYDYEVRYDAGPGDIAWMKERDRNYICRLLRDGTKTEVERADLEEVKTKPEFRKLYHEATKQYEASPEFKAREEQKRLAEEQKRLAEQQAEREQQERLRKEREEKINRMEEQLKDQEQEERIAELENKLSDKGKDTQQPNQFISASQPTVKLNLPSESGSSSGVSSGSRAGSTTSISDEAKRLQASYLIDYSKLTLGKKLGSGGFGVVYKGTYNHGDVAIKQLIVDKMTTSTENEFKNETSIMANSRHPNIVMLYGYTLSPYCMVMELMTCSLFDVLHNDQDLPWSLRFNIAKDIAAGLAHLHDNKIVHRDIKSLNVLLNSSMQAKLTDFGLSKLKSETKTTTKVTEGSVGTIQWMAPELFGLKPKYSAKSDIYAYGMVMWELTTGEIPYKDAQPDEIKSEVKQGNREEIPEDHEDCPPKMASLIKFCWMQDSAQRPTAHKIAEYLQSDAEEFVNEESKAPSSYRGNLDSSPYRGNINSGK